MTIRSMPNNKKFDDNYTRIFGDKKKKEKSENFHDVEAKECICVGPARGEMLCMCERDMRREQLKKQGLITEGEEI